MANETLNLNTPILTLDSDTVLETAQSKADLIWHDIQNAYRTRKILTGILGGIEKTEAGSLIAIIYYKDYRAVIPISEMMINLIQDETHDYGDLSLRQNKVLNNMLGCEIDFVIKGLDTKSRSIVASRKDAMLKKRQIFYFDQDSSGQTKIHEDRIVQARVIAVAEKVVRAEIFGVETSILARDLSFDWLGDARERFQVGEHILIRILTIQGDSPETLSIHADVKSVEGNTSKENLKNCRIQGKYAGTVEDIHKGTVFVRLELGVNAIAHSCYDSRTVGKKDKVSFGKTFTSSKAFVANIIPGIQNPHCTAPALLKAYTYTSFSRSLNPSTVKIDFPQNLAILCVHAKTGFPSTRTVQLPHTPSLHPSFTDFNSQS